VPEKPKVESKVEETPEEEGKKGKGKKKANNAPSAPKKKEKEKSKVIFVLPENSPVGVELPEIGRLDNPDLPKDQSVMDCYNKRKKEVGEMLHDLESRQPARAALWDETKEWSLTEFKNIYSWLDCRFDHDFFESQVGDASKKLVMDYYEKGVLVKSQGAIGADLTPYKLPFCILVKSDGTGLYATKDLALAHRKFTEFEVKKSVYVVDAAQTLHFQQVFKTLELMGYAHASKCFHLPYGQVRVPEGKMSSRKGTVIYFSDLQRTLGKQIYDDFLVKLEADWSKEELQTAQHALSVATIKYGMLNVDPSKDIVFEMSKWAAKSGDTGVYLMYAYARTQSILEKVDLPSDGKWNPSLLVDNQFERLLLLKMQVFWDTILNAAYTYKPSAVCSYLYEISKLFMSWYDVAPVKSCENVDLKYSRLKFVSAIGELLRVGLSVLGIRSIKRM
jgi:arginyl-tRNA synthetase